MDQEWQVCELEESSNIELTLYERFSVVSVPESWIVRTENGSLVCFWPSVDANKKIRSLHYPKDDEKCVYYKCRVLLDGAKFSTYKAAKEAELIAQNVSSIMDTSVLLGSQKVENTCNSTMYFDVSDADTKAIDENADNEGQDLNLLCVDDEKTDEIVGHDTFEYNKAMLQRRPDSKKAMTMDFEVEDIAEEFLQRETNETMSANFNSANFLTSTVIDEMDFSVNINTSVVSSALLKISGVELKLSTFVNDILNDLNKSKEILRQMENRGDVQEKEETILNLNVKELRASDSKDQSAEEIGTRFSNGSNTLNVQREEIAELPWNSPPTITSSEDSIVLDDIQNINETFVAQSANTLDTSKVQRTEILSIDIIPSVPIIPIASVPAVPIYENVPLDVVASKDFQSDNANVIRLPIESVEDHLRNEELLHEDVFEAALTEHLIPLADENENSYMNRTISIVFSQDFFLNGVSWKKQPGRINIKHSSLLYCWMESQRQKFSPGVDSPTFQEHFRRVKSAMRAAIKSASKRKMNTNANHKNLLTMLQTKRTKLQKLVV